MLLPEAEPRISSRESPNCFRATRKRFFNQKEFGSDVRYLFRSFRNSIIDLYCFLCHIHNVKFTQQHFPFSQCSGRHRLLENIFQRIHSGNEVFSIRRQIMSQLLVKPRQSTTRSLQQSVTRLLWSKLLAYIIDSPFLLSCLVVLTKYASECTI